ncbi:hypothetical protein [Nostoc sp. WHI]|uniref:hypothetical protein n=1 Tax=Nostoc sp. WHI TaxID=2650611 RepID=UPI0018C51108|nr:hypothetical protein [Nostoc sp. WHI]MBG1269577.1 hypothetical protein [Nostoc sp. WHI]
MAFVWLIQLVESDSLRTITKTPKFAGEAEILQSLLQIIEQPSENGDRLELLIHLPRHDTRQYLLQESVPCSVLPKPQW